MELSFSNCSGLDRICSNKACKNIFIYYSKNYINKHARYLMMPPQIPIDAKLQEWTDWLFIQPGGANKNACEDMAGGFTNGNQPHPKTYWLVAGTIDTVQVGVRDIYVPKAASIYIVVASSHGTTEERSTAKRETEDSYAEAVDALFDKGQVCLSIDGGSVSAQLKKVKTNLFSLQFNPTNPYFDKYLRQRNAGAGVRQNIVSYGRVYELRHPGGNTNTQYFEIYATRPGDPNLGNYGEDPYRIYVKFNVHYT
jgi:hypothetical protein